MTTTTFDSLGYFRKLKAAGVPEEQAQVQADAMRMHTETQAAALEKALNKYDEAGRKDLATKGDIQDVRNEIQDVRMEIQGVRNELADTKHEILKWMIATMVAQTALIVAVIAFLK